MRFRFAALAAVACLSASVVAQTPSAPVSSLPPAVPGGRHLEEGRPFIRTYAPLDVNAAGQNWSMVAKASIASNTLSTIAGAAPQFDDITLLVLRRLRA